MCKEPIYWTQKDGKKISVDDMDINHLRNVLKMILRSKIIVVPPRINSKFELHGDIAQSFNDECDATEIDIY
jgi:hypothetical protein